MRNGFTRDFYISATDKELLRDDALSVIVVCSPDGMQAKGFSGRRQRPDFHYRFRSTAARDAHVSQWHERLKADAQAKAARRAEAKADGHAYEVGDVLRCTWGYEQTNQDYYQVVKLVGKQTIEIREIESLVENTGDMSGEAVPKVDAFVGDVLRRRPGRDGFVKIGDGRFAFKEPYDLVGGVRVFKPSRWTSYA
ncbi:hypothetical protein [Achromobacter spanius]|uniref:hypothetical protein n=1 Tax=Achromobacter spanius TaxID=217203 RepID=UPI00381C73E7